MSQQEKSDQAVPEALSERGQLDRVVSFKNYIAIGFGVIIGVGWVVYAGHWLQDGGVLGAVLAFLLGGLLLIPVGKCYAELTCAMPVSGGELAFSYKAFGPLVAFITSWALALSYNAVVPFETIAVGAMVESIVPSLASEALYKIGGYSIGWSSIIPGLLAGFWVIWLNWRGIKDMARFQTFVIYALVACTAVFSVVAFVKGDISNLQPLFAGGGTGWIAAFSGMASVIVVVPFFLSGFDCIPQAAEEAGASMAPRQLGTAIIASIFIGVLFYVLVILALGYSASSEVLEGILVNKDKLPMAEVFRHSFGYEWAAKLVLVAALLGLISTLNGIFMASTRVLFAQGRGGLIPQWFAQLHPVHHTPTNAVLFVGAAALLGPFVGKAGLTLIVNSSSLIFCVTLLITALATLKLRSSAPDMARPYRINKSTIWAGIASSAFLIALMVVPGSPGQMSSAEFLTIGLWMAAGLVFYALRLRSQRMTKDEQVHMIFGEYK
ncbi:MAG: APC family permease [Kordiimonadaceae bacterium]|nr:APC family permease [Kordiimonadaceae bacterium]